MNEEMKRDLQQTLEDCADLETAYIRGRQEGAAEAWEEAINLVCVGCREGRAASLGEGGSFWHEHCEICRATELRERREALKKEQTT